MNNNTAPGRMSLCSLLTVFSFPAPQSAIAMGSPSNASMIGIFTGRRGTGSAASTALTTPAAFTASGARKGSTGREKETAAYPATVTPKVAGERAKKEGDREGNEGEEGAEEGRATRPRERCSTSRTIGNLTRHWSFLSVSVWKAVLF